MSTSMHRTLRDPADEWLRLGGGARLLGVSPTTLRRWSNDGGVPTYRSPGGQRRYRRCPPGLRYVGTPPSLDQRRSVVGETPSSRAPPPSRSHSSAGSRSVLCIDVLIGYSYRMRARGTEA